MRLTGGGGGSRLRARRSGQQRRRLRRSGPGARSFPACGRARSRGGRRRHGGSTGIRSGIPHDRELAPAATHRPCRPASPARRNVLRALCTGGSGHCQRLISKYPGTTWVRHTMVRTDTSKTFNTRYPVSTVLQYHTVPSGCRARKNSFGVHRLHVGGCVFPKVNYGHETNLFSLSLWGVLTHTETHTGNSQLLLSG